MDWSRDASRSVRRQLDLKRQGLLCFWREADVKENMRFLIYMAAPIVFISLVQLVFCFCKWIPVKLFPLAAPAALFIWYSINESQRTEPRMCGMGAAIMGMFLGILLVGITLGWIIYAIIWIFKHEDKKEE